MFENCKPGIHSFRSADNKEKYCVEADGVHSQGVFKEKQLDTGTVGLRLVCKGYTYTGHMFRCALAKEVLEEMF